MSLSLDQYKRMRDRNADYAKALARTNLAVRLWEKNDKGANDENATRSFRHSLMWLIDNHIVQAFYRRYGIDVIPFSIGGMYGYGRNVGFFKKICGRTDLPDSLAWIATGSSRVDSHKNGEEFSGGSYNAWEMIDAGNEPLAVIDYAARFAVGGDWPPRCPKKKCRHYKDADIYLTVRQILTLLIVMGYVEDAILGTHVDCSEYGAYDEIKHPLRLLGVFSKPCFDYDWFSVSFKKNQCGGYCCINRETVALVSSFPLKSWRYHEWCGGSVETGLKWIIEQRT